MHERSVFFILAVGFCANTLTSAAILSPHTTDFLSSVADFSPNLCGQWSLVSGKYPNQISGDLNPDSISSGSIIEFSNLGGSPLTAKEFLQNSTFNNTNSENDLNAQGDGILATNPDATLLCLADIYVAEEPINAQLRFTDIESVPTPETTMFNLNNVLMQGLPYLLQVEGKYGLNGDLDSTLEFTSGYANDFQQLAHVPAISVPASDYFGNRVSAGTMTSALNVKNDSRNAAEIPKLSSIGFVAGSLLCGYILGDYWRRRQAKITV